MDSKADLIKYIKEWVKVDNEIRQLKKGETKRKNEQKAISKELMRIMSENEIDEFDLKDGKLVYAKKSVKKPITKKALMDILSKYYEGDVKKAENMNNFIMDNRETKVVESITREIKK